MKDKPVSKHKRGVHVIIKNWIIVKCNSSDLIGLVAMVYEPLYHTRRKE